jgi:hypothetical protein
MPRSLQKVSQNYHGTSGVAIRKFGGESDLSELRAKEQDLVDGERGLRTWDSGGGGHG